MDQVPLSCVCATIRQLSRVLTLRYDHALRPSGLRATQFQILMTIQTIGQAQLSELEPLLDMDQTTLTRSLQVLERRGLLARTKSCDGRVKRLTISRKGTTVLERAKPLWAGIQVRVLNQTGIPEWKRLSRQLSRLKEEVCSMER
jgi:DNA-binding MarR family transcriptional regulator